MVDPAEQPVPNTHPYTCLSCALAFTTAQTQRAHYTTDLHRYNSKRAVAGLAPVDIATFNQKISERKHDNSSAVNDAYYNARKCEACGKSFGSEGAEKSHLASRRHKEVVEKQKKLRGGEGPKEPDAEAKMELDRRVSGSSEANGQLETGEPKEGMDVDAMTKADKKAELEALVQARLAHAPQIGIHDCLFCPRSQSVSFASTDAALAHMLLDHGFFLPDQEFLVDRDGLLKYLAESIAVWNVCVHCGTGFGGKIQGGDRAAEQGNLAKKGLERVRKHMCDKNHCKLAWDTEDQRLEYSEFFDYRSSYNTIRTTNTSKKPSLQSKSAKLSMAGDEWEDVSSVEGEDDAMDEDEEEGVPETRVSYGDSTFELVLPSGARIGHRALRYIYRQNLLPYAVGSQSTQAGNKNINLITRLAVLANQDKSSAEHQAMVSQLRGSSKASLVDAALVPARGGGLNFNQTAGTQEVIKARNRGEAKEAGKHIRTFRDANRREQFKTRVGCTSGNNQKHYRDPLLQ